MFEINEIVHNTMFYFIVTVRLVRCDSLFLTILFDWNDNQSTNNKKPY